MSATRFCTRATSSTLPLSFSLRILPPSASRGGGVQILVALDAGKKFRRVGARRDAAGCNLRLQEGFGGAAKSAETT
jgi:hypothetical protein